MPLSNELRLAARILTRRPGYALIVTSTLALGIGGSVAVFAIVDSVLLKPLPFHQSERIVVIEHHAPGLNLPRLPSSPGLVDFYRTSARQLTRMAAVASASVNLTGAGAAARVEVQRVTPEFF
jgi:hypothetical protein